MQKFVYRRRDISDRAEVTDFQPADAIAGWKNDEERHSVGDASIPAIVETMGDQMALTECFAVVGGDDENSVVDQVLLR